MASTLSPLNIDHRCADRACPLFGQRTSRACGCHKTREQMLIEQRAELLEALAEIEGASEDDRIYDLRAIASRAISKALGHE